MGRKSKRSQDAVPMDFLDGAGPITWSLGKPVEHGDEATVALCYAVKKPELDKPSPRHCMYLTFKKEKVKCKNVFAQPNVLGDIAKEKDAAAKELDALLKTTFESYGHKMSLEEKRKAILTFFEKDQECRQLIENVAKINALLRLSEQPDTLEQIKAGYDKKYF